MGLKENLKKYRLARDLTLDDVAKVIGTTRQTVQKYESGVISNIPSDKIQSMAELFRVPPGRLMDWDNGEVLFTVEIDELRDYVKKEKPATTSDDGLSAGAKKLDDELKKHGLDSRNLSEDDIRMIAALLKAKYNK